MSEKEFDQERYDWLLSCEQAGDFTEWNNWVDEIVEKYQKARRTSGETCDIPEIKLAGADLAKRNLKGIKLLFAHLEGANLTEANLIDVDLYGANLRGANLTEARLNGANLEEADLIEAKLEEANLYEAHLNGANLRRANLEGANLTGAYLRRAYLYNAKLERTNLEWAKLHGAHLEGANLCRAYLIGAYLIGAHLDEADFFRANLKEASLCGANLRGAYLIEARLNGADLDRANLEGASICDSKLLGTNCYLARVDGETVITDCEINEETDFTGVGLSGARIDPKLHTQLLRNIRKKQWEKWYAEKKILTSLKRHGFIKWMYNVSKEHDLSQIHQQLYAAESASTAQKIAVRIVTWIVQIPESLFMNLPAKVFWKISNYGTSTKRIIGVFLLLNGIFALIYSFIHHLPVTDLQEYTTWPLWLPMSFVQTILIPFSITEIELESISFCTTGLVVTHVILGYVILAALVTRFAVMFQDLSP